MTDDSTNTDNQKTCEETPDTPDCEAQREAELEEAYDDAVVELGIGIGIGLVPIIGQAIDAYDTIESAIALYTAEEGLEKEDAQFDFLLALIGWIPGPGDGVKKSLRIVNRDPERFAPVLFDLLREVLEQTGIETSPEELLDQIFNAAMLKAQIEKIKQGVTDSDTFEALPESIQDMVISSLDMAATNMPMLVGIVEKRIQKWKKMQRNSSAKSPSRGKADENYPNAKSGDVAKQGTSGHADGHANTIDNSTLGTQALQQLTNELIGISGEHIADYICAYQFGWGKDWQNHDDGSEGQWSEGTPSKTKPGKLSKGGSPKAPHVLYKLDDPANGTGLDAVWRADGHNEGKKYAIVEAKASRNEDAPKFLRKRNNTRQPSVTSQLGANVAPVKNASELLEPIDEAPSKAKPGKPGGKTGKSGQAGKAQVRTNNQTSKRDKTDSDAKSPTGTKSVLVQMSHEWIINNIKKAVTGAIADEIRLKRQKAYARHLFFSPAYHPSGSPAAHMKARLENLPPADHEDHKAFHYAENEVRKAVNRRKASLRKKHGKLPSLKDEK